MMDSKISEVFLTLSYCHPCGHAGQSLAPPISSINTINEPGTRGQMPCITYRDPQVPSHDQYYSILSQMVIEQSLSFDILS